MHTEKPIFTAQFHPEAFGGPTDTEVIFVSFCVAPVKKPRVLHHGLGTSDYAVRV